jgi:malate dehydrogenase (oxaloacetate-decarboxylating)(NADP+)
MAVLATEAKFVTDEMFICAAEALAEQVTQEMFDTGLIFPSISNILEVSTHIAIKVAKLVFDKGLARVERPEDIEAFIKNKVYFPAYH